MICVLTGLSKVRGFLQGNLLSDGLVGCLEGTMNQPLEGVKILDFGMAVATPLGTLLLADMGAEVIKIEKAQGECLRRGFPAG